jgi:thiamine kinase-like enzyme
MNESSLCQIAIVQQHEENNQKLAAELTTKSHETDILTQQLNQSSMKLNQLQQSINEFESKIKKLIEEKNNLEKHIISLSLESDEVKVIFHTIWKKKKETVGERNLVIFFLHYLYNSVTFLFHV